MLFKRNRFFNFLINLIILNWNDMWDFSVIIDCSDTVKCISADDMMLMSWELIAMITDLKKLQIEKCACLWSLICVWSCCIQMHQLLFYFMSCYIVFFYLMQLKVATHISCIMIKFFFQLIRIFLLIVIN